MLITSAGTGKPIYSVFPYPWEEATDISSLNRRLRRFITDLRKGKMPQGSMSSVAWASVAFMIFLTGGGIYIIATENIPAVFTLADGRWSMVYPGASEQTLNEGLVAMVLNLFMFGGIFLAYRSTKVVNDRRKANTMLMLGAGLLLMGLAGGFYLYNLKLTVFR